MDRLWRLLHEHRLRQLIAFGLTVGALGFFGYVGTGVSMLDAIYGTISLFTINFIAPSMMGGSEESGIPLVLEIARFTAPLVTAGTALAAVIAILRDEVDMMRARLLREHVIICGAGDRGKQLAIDLHERGKSVVVVENDSANAELSPLRHRHIPVVVGDATDPSQLKRSRAGRAERIIIVLDDDANARCLTALQTVPVEGHLQVVHCHVKSPSLDAYFTSRTTYTNVDPESRPGERHIEWFNIERLAATILLNEHFGSTLQSQRVADSIEETGRPPDQRLGIAIVGTSELARSLLLQAATTWNELRRSADGAGRLPMSGEDLWPRLPVTVIDEGSEAWVEVLRGMATGLDDVLEIECVQTSPFASGWDPSSVDVAYVTAPDPIEALEIAHYLEVVKSGPAQIVVRGSVGVGGLATVLLERDLRDDSIHMVNVIERTCTEEMVTRRLVHLLAVEHHILHSQKRPHRPATQPWEKLDPRIRAENLAAAIHHLEVKVPALDATLVPTIGLNDVAAPFGLSARELETLARLERERLAESSGGKDSPDLAETDRPDRAMELAKSLPMMLNACGYRLERDRSGQVESVDPG